MSQSLAIGEWGYAFAYLAAFSGSRHRLRARHVPSLGYFRASSNQLTSSIPALAGVPNLALRSFCTNNPQIRPGMFLFSFED